MRTSTTADLDVGTPRLGPHIGFGTSTTSFPSYVPLPPAATPGSYPELASTCASVVELVSADPERLRSPERDLGLRWRDGADFYRSAWIEATGEIYIVQLGVPEDGGGHVELLAAGTELADVERWLAGRHDRIDLPDSLRWLRRRIVAGVEGDSRGAAASSRS